MCILFLAIEQHSKYPLIACANRDEFYDRPTRPAQFWPENDQLLAGKDLQAGGSWMGINRRGGFAAVTNLRTGKPQAKGKRSRGELITRAIAGQYPLGFDGLLQTSDTYNPFNLIYGERSHLFCYNSLLKQQQRLLPGFHAVSNGAMDHIWPKMQKGTHLLQQVVTQNQTIAPEPLLKILGNQEKANEADLPDTGISRDWEKLLSSIFIKSEAYGTRSSTILLVDKNDNVDFTEVTFDQSAREASRVELQFTFETN